MGYAINNVLNAIQQHLVSDEIFTDSECFLSIEPAKIDTMGGVYCCITPGNISIDQGFVESAGIYGGLLTFRIHIRLWSQNALDDTSRDGHALTQNTLGIYSKLSQTINSLQMFHHCQVDTIGNFAEPMRLLEIDKPARDLTRPEWLYVDSTWEVRALNNVL
jgi:hypothetical protein